MTSREPGESPQRPADPAETLRELKRLAALAQRVAAPISIEQALREQWLEIWYQPKVDLKRRCLAGAEALAHVRHPELGLRLAAGCARGADDLVRLTEHAMLAMLRDWAEFEQIGVNLRLAVDVPVEVLLRLPIPTLMREHRPQAEHWPGVIIEVPEGEIARDVALASDLAGQLRISNVAISIDGFGGGYSSFASLRVLPFAELKLDRSFVRNCAADAGNAAICQTAVDLAHRLGSVVVAEGIDSMADLQTLQVMRCDVGQGVLLAPPMPRVEFVTLVDPRAGRGKPAAASAAQPSTRVASGAASKRPLIRASR